MRAFKKAIARVSRWALAFALLPVLWTLCHQLILMAPLVAREGVKSWGLYAAGAAGYLAVEQFLARPMWLYVFGHELTHAVTALLSGAKVHSFRASSKGGEVEISKSNVFIALSPYVVPLYAVILVVAYAVARRWCGSPPPPGLVPTFQVLLGIAIAFHFSLTFSAIHARQTDLKVVGLVLSGVLILIGNTLILSLLGVSLFTRTPSLKQFALDSGREMTTLYVRGLREVAAGFNRLNAPPTSGLSTKKDRNTTWTH